MVIRGEGGGKVMGEEEGLREGEGNSIVVSSHYMAIPRNAFLDDIIYVLIVYRSAPKLFVSYFVFPCFTMNPVLLHIGENNNMFFDFRWYISRRLSPTSCS